MKKVRAFLGCLFLVLVSGLASAGVNINGTTITFSDGSEQDTAGVVYTRIVVVPADDTDTANGTALLSALAGISTEAADNRFMLQLEPGTYDLGSGQVTMKPYVDLAGSGFNSSTITSSGGLTVALSNDSHVRHVELIQTGSDSVVVFADGVTATSSSTLHRVRLMHTATSGINTAGRFVNGSLIGLTDSFFILLEDNVSGTSIGISLDQSTLVALRVQGHLDNADTIIGVEVEDSILSLRHSDILISSPEGATVGIGISIIGAAPEYVELHYSIIRALVPVAANGAIFFAALSRIQGGTSTGLSNSIFVNCYDEAYAPIANTLAPVLP